MNTHPGILGKKLGCTQIFNDDGSVKRVTVIEAGPCKVVRKRTLEQDKYSAVQLAFDERREKTVSKPRRGYYQKNGGEGRKVTKKGKEVTMLPRSSARAASVARGRRQVRGRSDGEHSRRAQGKGSSST